LVERLDCSVDGRTQSDYPAALGAADGRPASSSKKEIYMRTLFVATEGVETAPLSNGSVVYNLNTGKFIMLNRSAHRVWSALAEPHTEQELVDALGQSYPGIDALLARQAVSDSLRELQRLELAVDRHDNGNPTADALHGSAAEPGGDFEAPSVKVLSEEDLLRVFQMTAAEISVASCWWGVCSPGCP
jgi:hypothetical protein